MIQRADSSMQSQHKIYITAKLNCKRKELDSFPTKHKNLQYLALNTLHGRTFKDISSEKTFRHYNLLDRLYSKFEGLTYNHIMLDIKYLIYVNMNLGIEQLYMPGMTYEEAGTYEFIELNRMRYMDISYVIQYSHSCVVKI